MIHLAGTIDADTDLDDVEYDPEPTDRQMLRFHAHEFGDCHQNIMHVLREYGPHTPYALRDSVAHSEQTIAWVLGMMADAGVIVRKGRRWALADVWSAVA